MKEQGKRILVCGGRNWSPDGFDGINHFYAFLGALHPDLIIEGGAQGADRWARRFAAAHGIPCATFHAWWSYHKKAAGLIRNGWMIEFGRPDLVVACPGGSGTANMVSAAEEAGIPWKLYVPGEKL